MKYKNSMNLVVIVSMVVLLSGCNWFMRNENAIKPNDLKEINETQTFEKFLNIDINSRVINGAVKLMPAVFENRIYVASINGEIRALSVETGETLWLKDIENMISAGVAVNKDYLVIGDHDGNLIILNPQNGEEIGRVVLSSEILSVPQINGSIVIVRTIDGMVYAVDMIKKEQKWVFERIIPPLTLRGVSDPVIKSDSIFVGLDNGKLVSLDADTGEAKWEIEVAIGRGRSDIERINDIDGDILLSANMVYVASYQAKIASYLSRFGTPVWERDISSYSGLSVGGDSIFVSDDEGRIWSLNKDNGASLWLLKDLYGRSPTCPVVFEQFVVVGDFEGYLHFINRDNGEIVGRIEVGSDPINIKPLVFGDKILVIDSDGELFVIGKNLVQ